jgi:mono/diheme cytochrome c family protein
MRTTIAIAFLAAASCFAQAPAALTGNAENGQKLFERNACYQCHGHVGQGGLNGPRLSQIKLTQAGFIAFVRNPPASGMPMYRKQVMSDQELADVYAYIKSIPEPKAAKDIPLLNP